MTQTELVEAVNQHVWKATGRRIELDVDTLSRYERGLIAWPGADYRAGLRAVLGVGEDAALGFHPTQRGRTADPRTSSLVSGLDNRTRRLLKTSERDSFQLLSDDGTGIDDLDRTTTRLAVEYLGASASKMLHDAHDLRSDALRRLDEGRLRGTDAHDVWLVIARLQGILAYAALDLGAARVAETHASAGHAAALRADNGELAAWARGTQALVARFSNDFAASEALVRDGMRHASSGSARIRLLCGLAQSRAGVGDAVGTQDALDSAETEREQMAGNDEVGGLFTFSEAKQHYYAASSLIWLEGEEHAHRATIEAGHAVDMWQSGEPSDRSFGDEALARVYRSTAYVHLNEVDAAREALTPVLDLPAERQTSWISKRLTRIAEKLEQGKFRGSRDAADLAEQLRSQY